MTALEWTPRLFASIDAKHTSRFLATRDPKDPATGPMPRRQNVSTACRTAAASPRQRCASNAMLACIIFGRGVDEAKVGPAMRRWAP